MIECFGKPCANYGKKKDYPVKDYMFYKEVLHNRQGL